MLALIAALVVVPAPADTTTIAGARGTGVPALDAWREAAVGYDELMGRLPGCWSEVMASISASYQIWHGSGDDRPALVLAGRIDRASLEKGVDKTLRLLRASPRLLQAGDVTEVRNERFDRSYLGWTPWFVVWHRDRARVQQLLASAGKTTIPSALAAASRACSRPSNTPRPRTRTAPRSWFAAPTRTPRAPPRGESDFDTLAAAPRVLSPP